MHLLVVAIPLLFIAVGIFAAITMGLGLLVGGLVGWRTRSMDNFVGTWIAVTSLFTIIGVLAFVGWLV